MSTDHYVRVRSLIMSNIMMLEKRIRLSDYLPLPDGGQYIMPLLPLLQLSLKKLEEQTVKAKGKLSEQFHERFVEESVELLEEISNQIHAFDDALRRSKWGKIQLSRMKKESRR